MTNSPFSNLRIDLPTVDKARLQDLADKAQALAAEAVQTGAELSRQTVEGVKGATSGSGQQVADLAVDALNDAAAQLRAASVHVRAAAEPTADQIAGAIDQLVTWLDARRDQLSADVNRARRSVDDRFAPATRRDVQDLSDRISVLEDHVTKSNTKKSTTKKSTSTKSSKRGAKSETTSGSIPSAPKRKSPKSSQTKSSQTKSSASPVAHDEKA